MKLKIYFAFTFFMLFVLEISAQQTYVPDDNFENYLENNGMGNGVPGDNYVLTDNIVSVVSLEVYAQNIADLTGIEDFAALQNLQCQNNQIETLDLTSNTNLLQLNCASNQLTSLDISNLQNLENVDCSYNQLNNLNMVGSSAITNLRCGSNSLTNLNLNSIAALQLFDCSFNSLTSLDLTDNGSLATFYCKENQLGHLDLSHNAGLQHVDCSKNQLTYITIAENNTLTYLDCSENNLATLNLESNTALQELYCYFNQLTDLNLTGDAALTYVACHVNNLTTVDLSGNVALEKFYSRDNQLVTLDFTNNANLIEMNCFNNQLTGLNIRNGNNANMTYFDATDNPNLVCIFVDDKNWSAAHWTLIDAKSNFVETQAECDALGIEDEQEIPFKVYPNPVTDVIYIQSKNPGNYILIDLTGKIIREASFAKGTNKVTVSQIPEGLYFLRIFSDQNNRTVKLVVNK
jgi:Leucine-rich repeat (LRR) protein